MNDKNMFCLICSKYSERKGKDSFKNPQLGVDICYKKYFNQHENSEEHK